MKVKKAIKQINRSIEAKRIADNKFAINEMSTYLSNHINALEISKGYSEQYIKAEDDAILEGIKS